MRRTPAFAVALVTAPNLKTARTLTRTILESKLAACVNLVPAVESHYRWRGKLESSKEVLLVIKTEQASTQALERCVLDHHPYDTPEFIVLPILTGARPYLDWISQSLS